MKSAVLLYNSSCIFEIVILNYFLKFRNKEVFFVSVDGKPVISTEGYSINVDGSLVDLDINELELVVIPGGDIRELETKDVYEFLTRVNKKNVTISAICAGVDLLEKTGVLSGVQSTKTADLDVVVDGNIITARANGYVDFAIEVAKKMNIFESDEDIEETVRFWKEHKRA